MLATDLLRAGSAQVVVAGGMESMTNAPYLLAKARQGLRMGHDEIKDAMFLDGLEDAETGRSMGTFAQDTADRYQITRDEMDAFATPLGRTRAGRDEQRRTRARDRAADASVTRRSAKTSNRGARGSTASDAEAGVSKTAARSPRPTRVRSPTARRRWCSRTTRQCANIAWRRWFASSGHATHSRHPSEFTMAPVGAIEALLDAAELAERMTSTCSKSTKRSRW